MSEKWFECEVYWVFRDGSRKRFGRVVVASVSSESARSHALRYLDEVSKYFPLADPEGLSHYDAVCREELESAGYIEVRNKRSKHLTKYMLTEKGREAVESIISRLEKIDAWRTGEG